VPLTYQTKIKEVAAYQYLEEYAKYFSHLQRKLFYEHYIKGKPLGELKKKYIAQYGITARQFNSLYYDLKGKIKSLEQIRDARIKDLKGRIKSLENWLAKREKQKDSLHHRLMQTRAGPKFTEIIKKYRRLKFVLHQKKRRLRNLVHKLDKLLFDKATKVIRLCFGSKKLFKAQHHLKENRYTDHGQWLKEWQQARSNQFFMLGSKDEVFGNQNCAYHTNNTLRIRVANKFTGQHGKYIILNNITFPYGQEHLDQAKQFKTITNQQGHKKKEYLKAISYRFTRKKDTWYLNASIDRDYPQTTTSTQNGIIALDLNAGFITAAELDHFGNPLGETTYPVEMYGKSSNQIEAALGDAIKAIVKTAGQKGKHLGIEDLDFTRKKQRLREASPRYARMLSGFTYSKFKLMVQSKTLREGVGLIAVNPFATSLAGQFKFMARYGLSSHGAAACVIGRRSMGFKLEKPVKNTVIPLPDLKRNSSRHVQWLSISRKLKNKNSAAFNLRIAMISADR